VVDVFQFVPGYKHYVYEAGREPLFFLLATFALTFAAARTYTRVGRARGWGSGSMGGIHLHHLVPGIIASLAAGTTIIAFRPGGALLLPLAALFGCGAALTLDEFALILHLEDVYWTREGRGSIEATLMGFALGLLCLLVAAPLSDPGKDLPHWLVAGIVGVNVLFALVAFLKGKAKLGTFGLFVPGVAILGALRLALPASLWARRFYSAQKLARSMARAELHRQRYTELRHRAYDAVGGKPHLERRESPTTVADDSRSNPKAG
jgi:hypothetical protein